MKTPEYLFLISVAVCLIGLALFFIGGALQDVDMHTLAELPITEQNEQFGKLDARREVGETVQFVSALIIIISFVGLMLISIMTAQANAEKPLKRLTGRR